MIKKLASQTAIYGASATIAKFLNYLLTPFLTRVMTDTVYGEVSYFFAIIPFANVLLTLGFSTGYFRFAGAASSLGEQKRLFSSLWGAVSIGALLFSAFGMVLFPSPAWILMFALILVDNVSAIPLSLLRQQGRALYYTLVNVSGVVVNVALCFWFYLCIDGAAGSPVWVLAANLIASGVSLLLLLPAALRMFTFRIDRAVLRKVALYSLPLMVAGVMGVASDFIDRQMLRWVLSSDVALAQLGVYSAVAKIAALMLIFRQIYALGAEPFFLQQFKKDDFSRLNAAALKYFTAIGILIFLGIMLYGDLFGLILGSSFRVGMDILPLLLFANLLSGILINLSFWYKVADKTKFAVLVTLCGVLFAVGLNFLLIPLLGYAGAAWARVGSALVMVVMSYVLGQKYYRLDYDLRSIGFYVGFGAAIYAASLFTEGFADAIRWSLNAVMIVAYCYVFIRKEKIFKVR